MKREKRNITVRELEVFAAKTRGRLLEMSYKAKAPHLGSALSCVDILVALYCKYLNITPENVKSADRDRFIMSKGHAASALYAGLACSSLIDSDLLDTFCMPGTPLEEHPGPKAPAGVEAATGSLGHGLSLGAGMALAGKIRGHEFYTIVLLSDGECNEGSVWEAAMFASGKQLNRLCAIVDFNKWQATGRSCEVTGLEPLAEKWRSFGWEVIELDGNNMEELCRAFDTIRGRDRKPLAVIAHTVKGKGVSFMEDDNNWHYRVPDKHELINAKSELGTV